MSRFTDEVLKEYANRVRPIKFPGDTICQLASELLAAQARIAELETQLAAIGDFAVADWDDKTVGAVDAIVKESTRYKYRLRALFVDIPKERDELRKKVAELEADRERLDWLQQTLTGTGVSCFLKSVFLTKGMGEEGIVIDVKTEQPLIAPHLRAAIDAARAASANQQNDAGKEEK